MGKEIKLLYCIRINGLSLVTFDTSEYLGGNTEKVSEISSAFGYLLDAENQLSVLKTIDVVTGPDYSLVGKGLCRECPSFLAHSPPACGSQSRSHISWELLRQKVTGKICKKNKLLFTKRWWGPIGPINKREPRGILCAGPTGLVAMTGSISEQQACKY